METIKKVITTKDRLPTSIRKTAHDALPQLCDLIAEEKQLGVVTYTDAITIAVMEALQKRNAKRGKTPTPKGN